MTIQAAENWSGSTAGTDVSFQTTKFNSLGASTYMRLLADGQVKFEEDAWFDERVGIGISSPSHPLHIEGEGATSATSAVLVENSSGDDLLEVRDDGVSIVDGGMYLAGYASDIWMASVDTDNSIHISTHGTAPGDANT